jgi:hypothetical protein
MDDYLLKTKKVKIALPKQISEVLTKPKKVKTNNVKDQIAVKTEDIRVKQREINKIKGSDLEHRHDIINSTRQTNFRNEYERLKGMATNTLTGITDKQHYRQNAKALLSQINPDFIDKRKEFEDLNIYKNRRSDKLYVKFPLDLAESEKCYFS